MEFARLSPRLQLAVPKTGVSGHLKTVNCVTLSSRNFYNGMRMTAWGPLSVSMRTLRLYLTRAKPLTLNA
jgi:hypothetical protein